MSCTPLLWPQRRERWRRRWVAASLAAILTAALLVADSDPAIAKHGPPDGASTSRPSQDAGSAAGRDHKVAGDETAAEGSIPPGNPPLPPGAEGVVGRERLAPDPGDSLEQCRPCPTGTTPQLPPRDAAPVDEGAVTLTPGAAPSGYVEGRSRELPETRTATSTTFVNPDGTKTLRMYSGPAFARDVAGNMVPIDTQVQRRDDGRLRPAAAADVSFAALATDPAVVTLRLGEGVQTGFGIADAAAVPAVTSGSDIRFADVRPDADLVLTPTKTGVSESIVLKSADAPTQWNFPLRLQGLAPELVGGGVELRDEAGEVRANIPPGFMYDSTPDPKTGAGVRSNGVTYALDRVGDAWNLRVTMDGRWLRDPARKFPVVVDPPITARDTTYIDSFVSSRDFANRDNSAETFLKVGTYNGGREKSAAYVRFFGAETLIGRYVQGASLNLYQTWARSCTASKLTVHRVYGDWWERDVLSWPGPAYDSANPVASKSFNRGGNCTSRPAGWESIPIDPERFTKWLDGRERWYGFSLRASNTDNNGEKFFYSSEYAGGGAPFIDLIYSDEGAAYSLPTRRFDPPVTPSTYGFLNVDVTNLGVTTWVESWDSPSPDLYGYIRNSAGTLVDTSVHGVGDIPVPHGVTVRLAVVTGFLPAGTYTITITMQDAQGRDFDSYYGVPHATVSFTVLPEATPEVVSFFPPNNAQVDRLRPALWAQYFDADNAPGGPYYWFRVCNGTADAPVGCQESQWVTSASWTVPAGVLSWGQTSFWYVAVHDGQNMSYLTGPYHLTPVVAQPEITHHLAGAPDGADVPGLNVQVGNYSTAVVDASVPVSGPPLEVSRTYNSQDPRSASAFGAGWSTPWDQRITADPDGSGSVVVTLTSGRQVRFGRNADGSFVPPAGQPLTLVRGSGNWTLRDSSGQRRVFDDAGRIIAVVDGYGRQQQFLYTSGVLSQVRDVASGRSLSVTWSGGRVSTVRSDAPAVGAAQPTWTYSYTGNRLTRVCSPLSEQSCVEYQYQDSSHYRSIVIDDNPSAYWPLGETSGGTAANVVARKPGEYAAKYSGVTLGQPGALAGSADTAARFSSAANGGLALPVNLTNTSLSLTVELWFKAASGQRGTLYAYQDTDLLREPGDHTPALYVDSGGKLRGQLWAPGSTQMVSPARVDNGQWHHVVLVGAVDRQELYLNGTRIGSSTGHPLAMLNMRYAYVGNGSTAGWPAAGSGNFPFIGQIDEVAFYRHALAPTQISAHYAARAATSRMTGSIEPGPFTAMQASYDGRSGRITTLQDRNGAEWTVGQPTLGDGTRAIELRSTGRDSVTYTFDATRGGRLTSRETNLGVENWEYDANGFVTTYTDANGRARWYFRDARGNITWEAVYRSNAWVYKNYGYHLNADDKLDPRNDRLIWQSGTRNAWDNDPRNRIRYELDTVGRPTKITYPGPAGSPGVPTELFGYTDGTEAAVDGGLVPAGLLEQSTNRLGGVTSYEYNSHGDLVRSTDPAGLITTYGYDLLGRNTSRTTGTIVNDEQVTYGTWRTAYNAASLVSSETEPGVTNPVTGVTHTAVTTYGYDPAGRVTTRTVADASGGDVVRTWSNVYDGAGRLIETVAPDGATTVQHWNTAGDLIRLVRPNGLVLEHQYDDGRRLIETAATGEGVDPMDPAATRLVLESRAYDPAGQLASVVDAMGRETTFTYHNDGLRETEQRVRRDADGEITSSVLLARYEYDHGSNLIRVTRAGGMVYDYDYDDAGLRNRETVDAAGLARSTIYTFGSDGQVTSRKQTNGFTFVSGRSSETPHLLTPGGSQIDGAGGRYADGTATFTYRFQLPPETVTATLNLEIDNQYLVEISPDNQTWREVLRETRDIRDGSNRKQWFINLNSTLAESKTVYVRVGDSQPANGWGGAVARVALEYTRSGEKPARSSYRYDRSGRLIGATVENPGGSPDELVTTIARDPRGLVTSVEDPADAITSYTYDAVGRVRTTAEPTRTVWRDGVRIDDVTPTSTLGYNTFGDATHARDAYAAVTTTEYDAMGRATAVTLPSYTPPGGTSLTPVTRTSYTYDGQPEKITDSLGRVTRYGYDKYGRLVSETLPAPEDGAAAPEWTRAYDRVGAPLETVDPTGGRVLATYNDLGHQITDTVAERTGDDTVYYTATLGRDDAGRLTSYTSPRGHTTSLEYNKAGEPTKVTDPVGRVVQTRYDALGRVTAQILAGTRATSYAYDAAGRQIRRFDHTVEAGVLSPPLRTTETGYDQLGRPTQVTSPEGRITRFGYDPAGNRTSVTQLVDPTDPTSAITVEQGYDALGRHTRTVDGRDNATDIRYNAWGLPTEVREPGPAVWTTVYDAAGQPVREELPGGVSRATEYDGLGRVTTQTGTGAEGGTGQRSLGYDALGRITELDGAAGLTRYTWNDRGLMTGSTSPSGTASFRYDGDGNLIERTDSTGTGTFDYDQAGRLKSVTDALTARLATFDYAPTGELATIRYGTAGPTREFDHDGLGRLVSDTVDGPDGTTRLGTTYTYDGDDQVTGRSTTGVTGGGSNTYGYDGLGRLISWTGPDGAVVGYGYDAASNRTSTVSPAGTRGYTYDDRNQLLTATGGGEPAIVNTWSARGTLDTTSTDGAVTTFRNDAFDRPVRVEAAGYTVDYTYDALDRLAQRNGVSLAYPDLTNNPSRVPTAAGEAVIFRDPQGVPLSDTYGAEDGRIVVTDRLRGDQVATLGKDTGAVIASRSYTPYGEVAQSSGRFSSGFQGGWTDPDTGQVNAHARWYAPDQATFTSRDSWTLDPVPVMAANRYAYAYGSPVTYADPTGHCPACAVLAPVAVGTGPIGWIALGVVTLAATAYVYDSYQGSCHASSAGCGSGSGSSGSDRYMSPELSQVRSLVGAVGSSHLYEEIYRQAANGASAAALISYIQSTYGSHPAVQQYTAAHTSAATAPATTAVTTTPPAAVPWTPPAATPPPAVGQTITNVRPPEVALLPAGQQLINSVETAATLTTPTILQANADGSDAANQAAATGAAAAAAVGATAKSTSCDPDPKDEPRTPLYRGVSERHPAYEDARNGVVTPWKGDRSLAEHNSGLTDSNHTSWSSRKSVAMGFATKWGKVPGVLLTAFLPLDRPVLPGWLYGGDGFGEDEHFIEGQFCGVDVELVEPDDYQR